MIDLDKLESRCKEASRNGYGKHPVIECASAEGIMELISRIRYAESEAGAVLSMLRQAEKDAARYRWIKSIARVIECEEFEMDMLDGQDLDAMVDECIEAMQCK